MSSTALWFTIVWIAIVALITDILGSKKLVSNFGHEEFRYNALPAILMFVPALFYAATRRYFIDTEAYRAGFIDAQPSLGYIRNIIFGDGKDKGFYVLNAVIKFFIGNRDIIYFFIIALISIAMLIYVYKKYSCSYAVSVFLFFASTDYLEWICNGMRQFLAVAVIFGCISFILKRKYGRLILIILAMSTIHQTALLMLPVIFIVQGKAWNKKTLFFILSILVCIYFLNDFTTILEDMLAMTQYNDVVQQFQHDDGVNILRVLVYAIPTIIALVFKRRLSSVSTPLSDLCTNMSILSTGIYILAMFTSGIYIGRIPIYLSLYNYILLPWEIENLFTPTSKRIVYVLMVLFYLAFYYYQVFIAWGL